MPVFSASLVKINAFVLSVFWNTTTRLTRYRMLVVVWSDYAVKWMMQHTQLERRWN